MTRKLLAAFILLATLASQAGAQTVVGGQAIPTIFPTGTSADVTNILRAVCGQAGAVAGTCASARITGASQSGETLTFTGITTYSGIFNGMTVYSTGTVETVSGCTSHTSGTCTASVSQTLTSQTVVGSFAGGSRVVQLGPGAWQDCGGVYLPPNATIQGYGNNPQPGSTTLIPSMVNTNFTCSGTRTNPFFITQDRDIIRGVSLFGGSQSQACITNANTVGVWIDGVGAVGCTYGVEDYSDGNFYGASVNYTQVTRITNSIFYYGATANYACVLSNGGFCSDTTIGPANDYFGGEIFLNGGTDSSAVFSNRIEDGGVGVKLTGAVSGIQINNNNCDKLGDCVYLDGSSNVTIVGNRGGANLSGEWIIEIAGANSDIRYSGNSLYGFNVGAIKVDAGATIATHSNFDGLSAPYVGGDFYDAFTQSIIQPLASQSAGYDNGALPLLGANALAGGNGLTSAWSTNHVTLATGGAGDPLNGATAANILEDTGDFGHYIFQSTALTSNQAYVCYLYFSVGTSGTRNIELSIGDVSSTNYVQAIWNPATAGLLATNAAGSAAILSTGTVALPGTPWYKGWINFNLSDAASAEYINMVVGTSTGNYTGDGTSNINIWAPVCAQLKP